MQQQITPDIVRQFKKPTPQFLCPLDVSQGVLNIVQFTIRDVDTKDILFDFNLEEQEIDYTNMTDDDRVMSYQFYPDYFDRKTLGAKRIFKTGSKALKNLLMIERFYFKDQLIQTYEFTFPFCIPNSTNEWESIYNLPGLSQNQKQQMILNSWETRSDTFYFLDNKLIIHQKAEFDYNGGQEEVD